MNDLKTSPNGLLGEKAPCSWRGLGDQVVRVSDSSCQRSGQRNHTEAHHSDGKLPVRKVKVRQTLESGMKIPSRRSRAKVSFFMLSCEVSTLKTYSTEGF